MWLSYVFKEVFGIDEHPNENNAMVIYDHIQKLLLEENINYVIQINGKKRGLVAAKRDLSENNLIKLIKDRREINKFIKDQKIKKQIFVPNKLLNIII